MVYITVVLCRFRNTTRSMNSLRYLQDKWNRYLQHYPTLTHYPTLNNSANFKDFGQFRGGTLLASHWILWTTGSVTEVKSIYRLYSLDSVPCLSLWLVGLERLNASDRSGCHLPPSKNMSVFGVFDQRMKRFCISSFPPQNNLTPVMSIADNLTTEELETWINCDMNAPPFHILPEEDVISMANHFDEPEWEISSQQSEKDDSVVPRICIQDAINASTTCWNF